MTAFIVFYISLFGVSTLFFLKYLEIRKGFRPMSGIISKIDLFLHSFFEELRGGLRYVNMRTVGLLLIFLAREGSSFLKKTSKWIMEKETMKKLQGKYGSNKTPNGLKNGNVSLFFTKIKERE